MNTACKNYTKAILVALFSVICAVFVFICLPQSTSAATGTLGREEPYVYFTYQNIEDDVEADGNKLTAGTYNVSVHMSGMVNSSIIQVSATYDTEMASVATTPVSLLSDTVTDMESMGYVLDNGNIVFGFVSTNDACSVLGEDTVIAQFQMTFAQDCDAETVITVSESPNLTFAQADYGDGYDDEYSLTPDAEKDVNYTGILYVMTCDVTPAFGYNVSGSLVVMTDSSGATNKVPVSGEYTIDVYRDMERTDLIKSVKSVESENANCFVIDGLTDGTYYATISSKYAFARDITIYVKGDDIDAGMIPIVSCNFNNIDNYINVSDIGIVYQNFTTNDNHSYDLNGDGFVNVTDIGIVYSCFSVNEYSPLTIQ